MLRKCYQTDCRFYTESDVTATIQWFFVDGTDFVDYDTPFRSTIWNTADDLPLDPDGLGEVYGAQKLSTNGNNPGSQGSGKAIGTQDMWEKGEPLPPDPPTPLDITGDCVGCKGTLIPRCINCPCGSWESYTLWALGALPTGIMYGSDGEWQLNYVEACVWRGPLMELPNFPSVWGPQKGYWQLNIRPNQVVIGIYSVGLHLLYFTNLPWDCNSCFGGAIQPVTTGFTLIELLVVHPIPPDWLTLGLPAIWICPTNEDG